MVYKSINDLAPTYLTEMFSRISDTCKRELRNTRSDIEIPMRKSANGQTCFSYKGAKMWNCLSLESKLSPTLKTFKKHSKPRFYLILSYIVLYRFILSYILDHLFYLIIDLRAHLDSFFSFASFYFKHGTL